MFIATASVSALLILLPASAATAAPAPASPHPVRVSGPSPFLGCTFGGTPTSVNFPNAEVEPSVATDQHRPDRVVGAWQQDRWNDGGAHGLMAGFSTDGGRTFGTVPWPAGQRVTW